MLVCVKVASPFFLQFIWSMVGTDSNSQESFGFNAKQNSMIEHKSNAVVEPFEDKMIVL